MKLHGRIDLPTKESRMFKQGCLYVLMLWMSVPLNTSAAGTESITGRELKVPLSMEEIFAIAHDDPVARVKFRNGYSSFFIQQIEQYEGPRLGHRLDYAAFNGVYISVYVYNNGITDIPDGPTSNLVREQLADAVSEIIAYSQYQDIDEIVMAPRLSPHFLQTSHILTNPIGARQTSYSLLRGQNGHFIKIRATGRSQQNARHIETFVEFLVNDLGISGTTGQ